MAEINPTVSIIMPIYNLEGYVGKSIDSVIGQTYQDWELIIVNDGSADATEEVVKSFAGSQPRIRYYSQENAGVSVARNRGLDVARGEYIAFLDGDDLWDASFLEKCIACQQQTGADFVFCRFNHLKPSGRLKSIKMDLPHALADAGTSVLQLITFKALFLMGSFIVRKELLGGRIYFEAGCRFGEDSEFICKVLTVAKKTYYLNEELFTYRRRRNSATRDEWAWQKRRDTVDALDRAYFFFSENYTGTRKNEIQELFCRLLDYMRYRLMLGMLKTGNFDSLHKLIAQPGWRQALQTVMKNYKFQNKIKAKIINGESEFAWRLLASLYIKPF